MNFRLHRESRLSVIISIGLIVLASLLVGNPTTVFAAPPTPTPGSPVHEGPIGETISLSSLEVHLGPNSNPPVPPKFLTLPFDQASGALNSSNRPGQGWWYNQSTSGTPYNHPPDPSNYQCISNSYCHQAIDFFQSCNSAFDVRAAHDGFARTSTSPTWGNYVYIQKSIGGADWYTLYAHLESTNVPGAGKSVSRGEVIGRSGKTGAANNCIHLHFELSLGGLGYPYRIDPYGVYGTSHWYPIPPAGQSSAWTTDPPSYPGSGGGDGTDCSNPNAGSNEIVLFAGTSYSGKCVRFGVGEYGDAGQLNPVGNDDAESIKVGSNVQAILYENGGFGGASETFTSDDSDLNNNSIGQKTSSVKVESRIDPPSIGKWHAEYFANRDWGDKKCERDFDGPDIDEDWGGSAPSNCNGMPSNDFSVRYKGRFHFDGGTYYFNIDHDDGTRLTVAGNQLVDRLNNSGEECPSMVVSGDQDMQVDFREFGGSARIKLTVSKSPCIQPPQAPSLKKPGNGSNQVSNYDLTFEWNGSNGASEYLAEWWGGPFATMQPCGWSSNTTCHVGQIAPSNTYSWHVKARNGAGESGWSETWTFSIQPEVCYTLDTIVSPAEGGSIASSPLPNCNNGTQYKSGTLVNLTGNPNTGYKFASWTNCDSSNGNTCAVTLNSNRSVTAKFVQDPVCYSLTLAENPLDGGNIVTSPAPNCNNGTQYTNGTNVTLTANASSGSVFESWSGDANGSANPTSLLMSGDKNVTANFSTVPSGPTIYEDNNPAVHYTNGWLHFNNGNASGGTYSHSNKKNAQAYLDVSGASSFEITTIKGKNRGIAKVLIDGVVVGTFDGKGPTQFDVVIGPFNLPDTGTHRLSVLVTGTTTGKNKFVVLDNFRVYGGETIPGCFSLTTQVNPAGSGQATASPGPNCGNGYDPGTAVTLTATPNTGSTFTSWAGCDSTGGNTCNVTMNSDRTVTANFVGGSCTTKPGKPQLLTPRSTKTVSNPVTLDWNDVACASYYQVEVRQNSKTGTRVANKKPTVSELELTLTSGVRYYWKLRACNRMGCSPWTTSWWFKVN